MPPPKMQPTFRLEVALRPDEAIAKLRRAIRSPEFEGLVDSAGPCLDFKIERPVQRIWSPHLSVQLSERYNGTELFCRFSPRPEVWTLFMMVYFAAVFCFMVGAAFGYVQWSLGSAPWALAAVPASLLVIASLHVASLVGQGLSAAQMHVLRTRFERACEIAFDQYDTLSDGEGI